MNVVDYRSAVEQELLDYRRAQTDQLRPNVPTVLRNMCETIAATLQAKIQQALTAAWC
jgi:Mor family transcriptional regulator